MVQSSACHIFPQNFPLGGKDKLAGAVPTEGNNTPTLSHTPTTIPVIALTTALSSVAQCLKDNL